MRTDLRCPVDSRTLFARIRTDGLTVTEENLIEIACDTCKRARRRSGEQVTLVLHRYNLLGDCVETDVVRHA